MNKLSRNAINVHAVNRAILSGSEVHLEAKTGQFEGWQRVHRLRTRKGKLEAMVPAGAGAAWQYVHSFDTISIA